MSVAISLETLGGGPVDDELVAAIQSLADSEGMAGHRYERRVVRILVQLIAAHAYGRTLLELMHLLIAAEEIGGRHGAAGFFWGVELARGPAFEHRIAEAIAAGRASALDITLDVKGLRIGYEDGGFLVHFGRMPLLAALYEFLIVTIGYETVTTTTRRARGRTATMRAVTKAANSLSRELYAYLRHRLPSAQHQRLHRRLVDHLTVDRGPGFTLEDIDDATVLSFWRRVGRAGPGEVTEVKVFRTIVLGFIQFRRALQVTLARRAERHAKSIGSDQASGEADLDDLARSLETLEEEADWLAALTAAPADGVKFLNQRERERLDLVARHGKEAVNLPLAVLRAGVFGDVQARLTEARRRGRDQATVEAMVREAPAETYRKRLGLLERIEGHVGNCRLAALHVLARHQRIEAIGLLVDLFPDTDFGIDAAALRHRDDGAGVLPIKARAILAGLSGQQSVAPEGMRAAARGFAAIARQGFSDTETADPAHAACFAAALPALAGLARALVGFRIHAETALAREGHEDLFARDRDIFAEIFLNLYGVDNDR